MSDLARTSLHRWVFFTFAGTLYTTLLALKVPFWLQLLAGLLWAVSMVAAGLFIHRWLFCQTLISPFQPKPKTWLWAATTIPIWVTGIIVINSVVVTLTVLETGIFLPIILALHQFQYKHRVLSSPITFFVIWGIFTMSVFAISMTIILSEKAEFDLPPIAPEAGILCVILNGGAMWVTIMQIIPRNDFLPTTYEPPKDSIALYSLRNCYLMAKTVPMDAMELKHFIYARSAMQRSFELLAYRKGAEDGLKLNKTPHSKFYLALLKLLDEAEADLEGKAPTLDGPTYCLTCRYPSVMSKVGDADFPICPVCNDYGSLKMGIERAIGHSSCIEHGQKEQGEWWIPIWDEKAAKPLPAWLHTLILVPSFRLSVDWIAFWWASQLLAGNPRLNRGMILITSEDLAFSNPTLTKIQLAVSKGLLDWQTVPHDDPRLNFSLVSQPNNPAEK